MVENVNLANTAAAQFGQLDAMVADDEQGGLRGETVIEQRSIQSLVMDSLEEVTFSMSDQIQSVDVEEVAVEDISVELGDKIKKYERLRDDLDKARGGLSPDKLRKILAALRSSGGSENALQQVAEQFEDPTDQFLALEAVMERLSRERGDRELKKAAKKASDTLWERRSKEIIAGLHATPIAERFARGNVEQFQALRESYRDQVMEQKTPLKSLKQLRERFDDDKLEEQLKFLIAAAGQDLGAVVSSTDKSILAHLVGELSRLELLSSMRHDASNIVERMRHRFSAMRNKNDWDLLEESLEFMEDEWLSSAKLSGLATNVSRNNIEAEIYIMRELNAFFRDIPIKAYSGLERRTRLLEVSQEVLDQLIQREEDEL